MDGDPVQRLIYESPRLNIHPSVSWRLLDIANELLHDLSQDFNVKIQRIRVPSRIEMIEPAQRI